MERLTQKNRFMWIIIVLFVLLGVTVGGWINASAQLSKLTKVDHELASYEDSLAVCENTDALNNLDNQDLCIKRLSELSKLLSKYEAKLKNIKVHAQI